MSAVTSLSQQELFANRFELLSRLADDLAHEIKNPFHAMIINLEVLRKRVGAGATDVALERAAVIEHEIQRVHQVVDHLLRLLRPDPEGLRDLDPGHVLSELVPLIELRARLARVDFLFEPCDEAVTVRARRDDLEFAVLNLAEPLLDALRATGGCLGLSMQCSRDRVRIGISASPAPGNHDGPRGTAEGILSTPDRFETARALAAELVRESGGRVERDDRGVASHGEFLVVLPRQSAA
ncbi:MAG: histidine kinase dimerization/phospho-acceptor domain-containing protein [Longimicrobiales bacterium]